MVKRKREEDDKEEVKVVLLDIEGTVCPISFVHDVLFPYFLTNLPTFLTTHWNSSSLASYKSQFPADKSESIQSLVEHCTDLTKRNVKDPALKALQGLVWKTGYENGEVRCELFGDVAGAFLRWNKSQIPIVIYSSGSIPAQKLLFRHTTNTEINGGDLTGLISGYEDITTAGLKGNARSYRVIRRNFTQLSSPNVPNAAKKEGKEAAANNKPPALRQWLFLSDNVSEVRAAIEAGMQARMVVRPGNVPLEEGEGERYRVVESFEAL